MWWGELAVGWDSPGSNPSLSVLSSKESLSRFKGTEYTKDVNAESKQDLIYVQSKTMVSWTLLTWLQGLISSHQHLPILYWIPNRSISYTHNYQLFTTARWVVCLVKFRLYHIMRGFYNSDTPESQGLDTHCLYGWGGKGWDVDTGLPPFQSHVFTGS